MHLAAALHGLARGGVQLRVGRCLEQRNAVGACGYLLVAHAVEQGGFHEQRLEVPRVQRACAVDGVHRFVQPPELAANAGHAEPAREIARLRLQPLQQQLLRTAQVATGERLLNSLVQAGGIGFHAVGWALGCRAGWLVLCRGIIMQRCGRGDSVPTAIRSARRATQGCPR